MARTGKTLFQNCEAYTVQQYGDHTGWLRGRVLRRLVADIDDLMTQIEEML